MLGLEQTLLAFQMFEDCSRLAYRGEGGHVIEGCGRGESVRSRPRQITLVLGLEGHCARGRAGWQML